MKPFFLAMAYTTQSAPEAIDDLKRLSNSARKRIVAKIDWLAANFDQI
jgi:mRNA interferase RelE/StbE